VIAALHGVFPDRVDVETAVPNNITMAHYDAGWWGHPRHQQSPVKAQEYIFETNDLARVVVECAVHSPRKFPPI
jgi:hypothetical protein